MISLNWLCYEKAFILKRLFYVNFPLLVVFVKVTMKKTSTGWQHAFESHMLLFFLYYLCFCKVCRSKDSIYCAGYTERLLGKHGDEQNLPDGFVKRDNQINFKIADCYLTG